MEFITLDNLRHYHSLIKEQLGAGNVDRITETQINELFASKTYIIRYTTSDNLPITSTGDLPAGWVHDTDMGDDGSFGFIINSTTIPNRIFTGNLLLTSVNIQTGITTIGEFAFEGCNNLTSVTIPEGMTHIGTCAFRACFKKPSAAWTVVLPNSLVSMDESVFDNCSYLYCIKVGDVPYYPEAGSTTITITLANGNTYTYSGCMPGPECVLPGTQILTSLTGNTRCVEDFQEGDSIITHDGNSLIEGVVSKTVTISHDDYIRLTLDNGAELGISYDHAIDTPAGWKAYKPQWSEVPHEVTQLVVGDVVNTVAGTATITNIEEIHETQTMYNLGVKGYHNYFANGVLVHECSNDE